MDRKDRSTTRPLPQTDSHSIAVHTMCAHTVHNKTIHYFISVAIRTILTISDYIHVLEIIVGVNERLSSPFIATQLMSHTIAIRGHTFELRGDSNYN